MTWRNMKETRNSAKIGKMNSDVRNQNSGCYDG